MAIRRHRLSEGPTADDGRRRFRVGRFLKRWTIPIIGALTPLGLIAVNISIFIAKHLSEFRWTIAILAFVSGIMLNSWAGLNIYRFLQERRPGHALVHERNQEIVLVAGMAIVIAAAFISALLCYLGLSNEANLPNGQTFFTGLFSALIPFALQAFFRRRSQRVRNRSQVSSVAGLPGAGAAGPPPAPSARDALPGRGNG